MILKSLICNIFLNFIRGPKETVSGDDGLHLVNLNLHLQLHLNHCRDIETCGSVDDNPEYLPDFTVTTSCCLPCPCLESCSRKHICCPASAFTNNNTFHVEDSSTIISTFSQFTVTQSTSDVTNEIVQRPVYPKQRVNDHRYIRQLGFGNNKQNVSFKAAANVATSRKIPLTSFATPTCIKPQLFDGTYFIDSKAYLMVEVCIQDNNIIECSGFNFNTSISEMIPITSKTTGLTYVNRACYICNEANEGDGAHETTVDVWDAIIVHYGRDYYHRFVLHPDDLIDHMLHHIKGYINIHFVPRSRKHAQHCETYDIASCNKTGLWKTYEENVETLCLEGHSLPILHKMSYDERVLKFKNIGCVYCNMGNDFDKKNLSCGYMPSAGKNRYSQTLNVRIEDERNAPYGSQEQQRASNMDLPILPVPFTQECHRGYIALLGRCRQIICPRDYYMHNNKCVPFLSRITGMDINVKIDAHVFVRNRVPQKFSSEILIELRKIVNVSLNKCKTLEYRDIRVWYGPKGSRARDKYYMFDIFLFNASGAIDFSEAVNETRAFYENLKTTDFIFDDEIRISMNFNHRVFFRFEHYYDLSAPGDGSLRVVVGRSNGISNDRPYATVSNVNWCNRVPFDLINETNYNGLGKALYIKPAGKTVYGDEYDRADVINTVGTAEEHLLYLCIDLFKTDFDKAVDDITIAPPNAGVEGNTMTFSVPINIAIIVACLMFCVICVLCKRRFAQSFSSSVQQPEQSNSNGGIENDIGMAEDAAQYIEMADL